MAWHHFLFLGFMPFFFMLIAVAACWRRRAGLDLLLAFGFPYILHPFPCILTPPSSTSSTDTFLRCLRTVDAVHLHLASGTCAVRLATFGASPTWLLLSYCGLQLRARVTPPVGCNALFVMPAPFEVGRLWPLLTDIPFIVPFLFAITCPFSSKRHDQVRFCV